MLKTLRGGSWWDSPHLCASRDWDDPLFRSIDLGFRCVQDAGPKVMRSGSWGYVVSRLDDRAPMFCNRRVEQLGFRCVRERGKMKQKKVMSKKQVKKVSKEIKSTRKAMKTIGGTLDVEHGTVPSTLSPPFPPPPLKFIPIPGTQIEMTDTPITVGQYESFCAATKTPMPEAPSFNPGWAKKDHPMVNVTWDEAKAFCEWAGGRLPNEEEWEHAARGGLKDKLYPWGDEEPTHELGAKNGACFYDPKDPNRGTMPVKSYQPNGYGLYDMAGNVWEWMQDEWKPR